MSAAGSMHDENGGRSPPVPESDGLSLIDLIAGLWRQRLLIASTCLGTAALALGVALLLPKLYRAEVTLMPAANAEGQSGLAALAGQVGSLASLAGISLESNGPGEEAIALLRSRALAEEFIRRKNLITVLLPGESSDRATLRKAYEVFDRDVRSVSEGKDAAVLKLAIKWHDRVAAAEWANELVDLANQSMQARLIEDSVSRLKYLEAQLSSAQSVELRDAIYRIVEAEVKSKMIASVQHAAAFRVIDPAVVADPDENVSPKPVFMTVFGALLGLAGGVLVAYLRSSVARRGRIS